MSAVVSNNPPHGARVHLVTEAVVVALFRSALPDVSFFGHIAPLAVKPAHPALCPFQPRGAPFVIFFFPLAMRGDGPFELISGRPFQEDHCHTCGII